MQILPTYKKWILFIAVLIALGSATPVLADWLKPNRTVTTTITVCHAELWKCMKVGDHYKYKRVQDWSCPNGGRACEGYPDESGDCDDDHQNGQDYCSKHESTKTTITVYEPATITGTIENCTAPNGWCITPPTLSLSAEEPLAQSGYKIILIEGIFNGVTFACPSEAASCSIGLQEGENNFEYWALSSWGDGSEKGFSSARVDTVPPDVSLNISGMAGNNGWYKSAVQVSAAPSDATSGVATFEVAVDGGAYQIYTTAIPFTDGRHTLQLKAVDNAGNVFETPVQNFNVDTIPPAVDVRAGWQLGKDVSYRVDDGGSGLEALRIVIEDEDEKFAKMTWDRDASGASYSSHLDWNGEFKDETVAPPGSYLAWFKARDVAGNERIQLSRIVVPEPNVPLSVLPTEDPIATDLPVPPAELSDPAEQPPATVPPALDTSPTLSPVFGEETTESTGTTEGSPQSILLSSGTAPAASTSSPGILWGAAAAAAIAAATAYALEATRQRKEAEAEQAARVKAEIARGKEQDAEKHLTKTERAERAREHDEKVQERKEREEWADLSREEKARLKWEQERDDAYAQVVYENWLAQQEIPEQMAENLTDFKDRQEARWDAEQEAQEEAAQEQREQMAQDARNQAIADKMTKFEAEEETKWAAAQASVEATQPANWWEATKSFVKDKIIDPVNEKVVQPYVKPYVELQIDSAQEAASWVNETVIQPYVMPLVEMTVEDAKEAASWVNEKVVQPYVMPLVEQTVEDAKKAASWVNEKVVQPYIMPMVEKQIEDIKKAASWVNEKVVQPYIAPIVSTINEKVIQPYVKPLVDQAANDFNKADAWLNEKIYQPINEKIYQPVFAPVVNDINKYIYQPLAEKASDAWDEYGEWVHGALDAAGFIPGAGEIADGINGVIYLAEGRYVEAAVSAMSMIPVIGDLSKGGKWAVKAGVAVGAAAGVAAAKVAKEVAEEAIEKIAKEVVEEALEKGAKEVAEEMLEKVGKEVGEEAAEKIEKEIAEETIEKVAKETAEEITEKVATDAAERTVKKVTSEAEKCGTSPLIKRVSDAVNLVWDRGPVAIKVMLAAGVENANKLFRVLDKDVLDYAVRQGSDAIDALARWSEEDLSKYGPELALRAKKDGTALAAVKKLISSGPIDPKHLTEEQEALIKVIAENSTQYSDAGQVVLGKWIDQGGGFVKVAMDTGSVHYNPHPDMWKMFGSLGDEGQGEVAWLINKQVIQTGVEKGLPFEYALNGIPTNSIVDERNAIKAIFAGADDAEIMNILRPKYGMPIRMKELQELQKAGYKLSFDRATNSYILILP